MPERILVHVASPTDLAVAKMVERCTDAALVTARLDLETGEAVQLVGGRLRQDGTQEPQAWLDLDASARRLDVRLGDPASAPAETLDAPPAPWRMYDFDFAEFALAGPRGADARRDFSFGLAVAWPDGTTPLVRGLGRVDARYFGAAQAADGRPTHLYDLASPGLARVADSTDVGTLILDAEYGHVVDARITKPNHTGYTDFMLKLDSVVGGEDAWREALAAHWAGC